VGAEFASPGTGTNGIAFLVSAGVVYEVIAAACSSPQTLELNAASRAATLWKWVNLGIAQAVLFVAIASYIDRKHRSAIISGGATAAALMYAQYYHARSSGLKNGGPPTESYGRSWG
jgi:hypothetical protein